MSEATWDWQQSRCLVVVSASQRLAEEWVNGVTAAWSGPIQRHRDPAELAQILLGLDTPSLFDAPALVLVHASDKYLNKQRDALMPHLGLPAAGGLFSSKPRSCRPVMSSRKRRKRRVRCTYRSATAARGCAQLARGQAAPAARWR